MVDTTDDATMNMIQLKYVPAGRKAQIKARPWSRTMFDVSMPSTMQAFTSTRTCSKPRAADRVICAS